MWSIHSFIEISKIFHQGALHQLNNALWQYSSYFVHGNGMLTTKLRLDIQISPNEIWKAISIRCVLSSYLHWSVVIILWRSSTSPIITVDFSLGKSHCGDLNVWKCVPCWSSCRCYSNTSSDFPLHLLSNAAGCPFDLDVQVDVLWWPTMTSHITYSGRHRQVRRRARVPRLAVFCQPGRRALRINRMPWMPRPRPAFRIFVLAPISWRALCSLPAAETAETSHRSVARLDHMRWSLWELLGETEQPLSF